MIFVYVCIVTAFFVLCLQPAECHVCMEPEWTQTEIKVRFLCPDDIEDVKALGQECFPIE